MSKFELGSTWAEDTQPVNEAMQVIPNKKCNDFILYSIIFIIN